MLYSAYGSGTETWDFKEARTENGVCVLEACREYGEMSELICDEPGTGTRFTLRIGQDRLLLSFDRPTRVRYCEEPTADPPRRSTARFATREEKARLEGEGEDLTALWLDEGHTSSIVRGWSCEEKPLRGTDDEELEQIVRDAFRAPKPLTKEETDALWKELDGVWLLEIAEQAPPCWNDAHPLQSMVCFAKSEHGAYVLQTALPETEWSTFYIDAVSEKDGVYTITAAQKWGMMFCNEFDPGTADVFTLTRGADGTVLLGASAPARYGTETVVLTDTLDEIGGRHWRFASTEEAQRAAREGTGGVLVLENGDMIAEGYAHGPVRYRLETPEVNTD